MDRFEWLKCQPWLLPWEGCCSTSQPRQESPPLRRCASCEQGNHKDCLNVNWVFHGLASFCTIARNPPTAAADGEQSSPRDEDEVEEEEEDIGPLSQNAAHLFFSRHPPSLPDPAQLVLNLGIIDCTAIEHTAIEHSTSSIVLTFDGSGFFMLDLKQVFAVSIWKQEEGCKSCRRSSSRLEEARMKKECGCQSLPSFVTIRLKHVSLIIYSMEKPDESAAKAPKSSIHIIGGVDLLLQKALEEERSKVHNDQVKRKLSGSCQGSVEPSSLVTTSMTMMQRFLMRLDSMHETAVKAVEVSTADGQWASQLLHIMTQHAVEHRERENELFNLQYQLQSCLQSLEEAEQSHIMTIWGSTSVQQQEPRMLAVTALQQLMDQRKLLEEAILWVELMSA